MLSCLAKAAWCHQGLVVTASGLAPARLMRQLSVSSASHTPKTGPWLGGHGRSAETEDPVKELKEDAAKVKAAVSGDSSAAQDIKQAAKDMASWTAQAAKDTVVYTAGNVGSVIRNAKEDLKKATGPDPELDNPTPTGKGTRADFILQRDFTDQVPPTAGPQSFEARMGGQPAGNSATQPSPGGEPAEKTR